MSQGEIKSVLTDKYIGAYYTQKEEENKGRGMKEENHRIKDDRKIQAATKTGPLLSHLVLP